ncbi:hypothetical protein HELRODRAFT_80616 [Helobdella robusta]|uniref:Nuclear factor of activated T-cells 5 n=1 Tax=Helobdella robusta TaxID=6412 RepID=T1G428_HELRO|nr:hypothetical protein HELRODRAFT_80616 [Helobdella robusta]ESO03438.1 hypothetical protein HELRODRAFT_80616 [Helobdella robusta]
MKKRVVAFNIIIIIIFIYRAGKKLSSTSSSSKHSIREPSLNIAYPAKTQNYELKILRQPEDQHRARYLTEGSRGTVKDKTGQSHPTVRLIGYDRPCTLQVYVGTDTGKLKPHGFYQACKVTHKNSSACLERDIDGTTVIELPLDPKSDMTAVVDCVGILKLRNADVEQRVGIAKSKKKSTVARLVFRVTISDEEVGSTYHTLQVASNPIVCTQPTGIPEISKKSLTQCSVKGGEEMFIIGKNFLKGTTVVFEEVSGDVVLWSKEADIDQDYFQATHLVCNVPSYRDLKIQTAIDVQIIVHSGGRMSEPVSFTYLPCLFFSVHSFLRSFVYSSSSFYHILVFIRFLFACSMCMYRFVVCF